MCASDPAALRAEASASAGSVRTIAPDDPLFDSIGRTPLLPLRRLGVPAGTSLWGKAEFRNPTGSVKDRAAAAIVRAALRDGRLDGRKTLLDASSGNTAVAYAMLGARLGIAVEIVVPRQADTDRLRRLEAYGARVLLSDPTEGTDGAQRVASEIARRAPDRYFYADQYSNLANPQVHYATTGPEIWMQTHGRVTHLVAGIGTGGTISGTARFLKERRPTIEIVGVQPDGPVHGLEGLKHLDSARRPGTYDPTIVDRTVAVDTEAARAMAARLGRDEGLIVGASAGAAVVVALRVVEQAPGATVVAILPDGGPVRSSSEGR